MCRFHYINNYIDYSYETGNNIIAQEEGYLEAAADADSVAALVQQGSYSYVAPNGELIQAKYVADKNGFRVEGAHIPTSPPVSAEIQKALDLIYAGIEANRVTINYNLIKSINVKIR